MCVCVEQVGGGDGGWGNGSELYFEQVLAGSLINL